MKFKKFLCSALMISCLAGISQSFADSSLDTYASGGWSESGGYYSTLASSSPESHTGGRNRGVTSSGDPYYSAWGKTSWSGVYHYTRARMESPGGTVYKDSYRKYNTGNTSATSPDFHPLPGQNTEARSYWGK